ncbi:hypothetical protein C3729_07000 [Cloacibacterium normanense]|uniref:DUF5675 domain-containing protein n=1 Tax=Cloacibacterium normanense TaxID=237258 RepID=A0A2S7I5E4_9FLAO|nr:DUF5675 family protein [Cloacibacterium normanense]PPZ91802.1 hypothetical protein C3729_07000 [Cloacibacterium normanense]
MEIVLERMYFPEGTNGFLSLNGKEICKTIELPWRNNKARVSCIPEGKYKIRKRYSAKFKWHLELINVKNRKYILLHPANNALKELNGCIAPVSQITGEGRGNESRKAFEKLKNLVFPYLENGFVVELIVTKKIK